MGPGQRLALAEGGDKALENSAAPSLPKDGEVIQATLPEIEADSGTLLAVCDRNGHL